MRSKDIRTLIVGAGISGLAAARALHAWGAEVEVVERTAGPAVAGAGIYLPGNTSRALHRLGLGSVLERRALRIAGQTFADHSGRVLARIDTAGVWGDVGDCLAMPRAALLELLLSGAADVPIRWGVEPRTVTVGDDGATVELSDGTHGRYDLVLGADGVHSAVRRLVFGDGGARPVGQYAYRFLLDRPGFAPEWSVRLGRGSSFLMIPVGGDQVYCYCDGPAEPIVPMHRLLSAYAEPVPTLLAALDQAGDTVRIHAGPIEEVVLDRWSRGRVLLIGDAAHATSPNMAQGAAMALEDAVVLADSLAAADHLHDALHAYELRRRRRTEWVLHQTHRRDRTRNLPAIVRNAVLRRFGERIYHANYRPLLQAP